ncbi:50S ribosomal protein L13 [Patescibacteria group bacterium]|nr:50S ribosomal protein L13 [Patescibacteria group bacterium]
MNNDIITIDATGKVLGRLASEISQTLRGKDKPTFEPHIISGPSIIVENCNQIKITGKKSGQKEYYHHSGYPGGLKTKKLSEISKKDALKRAVLGMLPKNKLQNELIKRLTLKD